MNEPPVNDLNTIYYAVLENTKRLDKILLLLNEHFPQKAKTLPASTKVYSVLPEEES